LQATFITITADTYAVKCVSVYQDIGFAVISHINNCLVGEGAATNSYVFGTTALVSINFQPRDGQILEFEMVAIANVGMEGGGVSGNRLNGNIGCFDNVGEDYAAIIA